MKIFINTRSSLNIIDVDDIVFLKADGNYTQFHYADGKVRTEMSFLSHFEELITKAYTDSNALSPFLRANRSLVVNTDTIKSLDLSKGILTFQSEKVRTIPCTKETLRTIRDFLVERYHIQ